MNQKYIIQDKKLISEYEELKKQVENTKSKFTIDLYKILEQAYRIGKKLYGVRKFGYPHLARDFNLSYSTVVRVMSLNRASFKTKQLIKQGKIGSHKVALILQRKSRHFQDEIVNTVIKYNLSTDEIMKMNTESSEEINREKERIARDFGFYQKANALRSWCGAFERMERALEISPKNLPNGKLKEVRKKAKKLKNKLEEYLVWFE